MSGTTVRLLPECFRSDGFSFRQLDRAGSVALFVKSKRPDGPVSFEVVRIRCRPAERAFGVEYPARETMPESESWGTDGFTFCDVVRARAKFAELAGPSQDRPALPAGAVPGAVSAVAGVEIADAARTRRGFSRADQDGGAL